MSTNHDHLFLASRSAHYFLILSQLVQAAQAETFPCIWGSLQSAHLKLMTLIKHRIKSVNAQFRI